MNDFVPRLTVHVPPRAHKVCVLCNADFLNRTSEVCTRDIALEPTSMFFGYNLTLSLFRQLARVYWN